MKRSGIEAAHAEALRFIDRAETVLNSGDTRCGDFTLWGSKETGALRRVSMDLTRALADMRRP